MTSPEGTVLVIVIVFVAVSYGWAYPRMAAPTLQRIAQYDVLVSALAILVSGWIFWDTGIRFNALIIELNWFWFTLLVYALVETPVALWYFKRFSTTG